MDCWVGLLTEAGELCCPGYARKKIHVTIGKREIHHLIWKLPQIVEGEFIQYATLYTTEAGKEAWGSAGIGKRTTKVDAERAKDDPSCTIEIHLPVLMPGAPPPGDDRGGDEPEPEPPKPPGVRKSLLERILGR